MNAAPGLSLHLNVPAFFSDPTFVKWLNDGNPKFTWHQGGTPNEFSDVVVLVEPSLIGEGSEPDMPGHIWEQIIKACRDHLGSQAELTSELIMVRLTNLEE